MVVLRPLGRASDPRGTSCSRAEARSLRPHPEPPALPPQEGQESNHTTWRLCKMNLAIRGIDGKIAHGDSLHNDQHPDLKADYVLANSRT